MTRSERVDSVGNDRVTYPMERTYRPVPNTVFILGGAASPDQGRLAGLLREVMVEADVRPHHLTSQPGAVSPSIAELTKRAIEESEIIVADLGAIGAAGFVELGIALSLGKQLLLFAPANGEIVSWLSGHPLLRYQPDREDLGLHRQTLLGTIRHLLESPSAERMMVPLPSSRGGTEPRPGQVVSVSAHEAWVRDDQGIETILLPDDFSWTRRVKDLSKVLSPGQVLNGGVYEDDRGQLRYTLKMGRDPWPRLINAFPLNESFSGQVVSFVPKVGLFVALDYGINGLVPRSHLPRTAEFTTDMLVDAYPVRIDPARYEVELRLLSVASEPASAGDERLARLRVGQRIDGRLVKLDAQRGYALVELDSGVTGLLHARNMSEQLRAQFEQATLRVGDAAMVEILEVDYLRRRVQLRDLPRRLPIPEAIDVSNDSVEVPTEEYLRDAHDLLRLWGGLEPYILAAQRRYNEFRSGRRRKVFTPEQMDVIDRWYTLFSDDLAAVTAVRNEVAHGFSPSPEAMREAIERARHLHAHVDLISEPSGLTARAVSYPRPTPKCRAWHESEGGGTRLFLDLDSYAGANLYCVVVAPDGRRFTFEVPEIALDTARSHRTPVGVEFPRDFHDSADVVEGRYDAIWTTAVREDTVGPRYLARDEFQI